MIVRGVSINDMISQSLAVLTKPSIATFEEFEKRGGQREALTYVGVAAAVAGVAALLFGLLNGIMFAIIAGLFAFATPLILFFVGANVVHAFGTGQGGTGTKDEVFYTLALLMAPILAINGAVSNIPLLACLAMPLTFALGIYQIYVGYLGIRSSMNLDQNKAIITMVVSWVAQFLVWLAIVFVTGIIFTALGIVVPSSIPSMPVQ